MVMTKIFVLTACFAIVRICGSNDDIDAEEYLHRAKRGISVTDSYWKEGVPYRFKEGVDDLLKELFTKAVQAWQENTCVNFTEIEQSSPNKSSILVMRHISQCSSGVGKAGVPDQRIYLAPGCEFGTMAHELGHTLGLVHTHERPDRDKYIKVFVEVDPETNFDFVNYTHEQIKTYGLGYDYGSIMQYAMTDYGSWLQPSMMPLDEKYNYTLGSRALSFNDYTMINERYGCKNYCLKFKRVVWCKNGGYEHPRNCSRCLCPSGFGGDDCSERPNENNCGDVLNATDKYQAYTFTFNNDRNWKFQDGFKRCYYWVKSSAGYGVDIKIMFVSDRSPPDGCRIAGIEIKSNKDQTLTGYRVCHISQKGTLFESSHSIVPIITFSKVPRTSTYTIEYRQVRPEERTTTTTTTTTTTSTPTTTTTSTTSTTTTTTTSTTTAPPTAAPRPPPPPPPPPSKKKKNKKKGKKNKKSKSKKKKTQPKPKGKKKKKH